ncbi:MAG: hypothetical protein QNJ72_28080 [Pleurocapsa sp. MO_226.B13]|nr:hypothetical protein [Pleurocapsa sp. MO_226.B13]
MEKSFLNNMARYSNSKYTECRCDYRCWWRSHFLWWQCDELSGKAQRIGGFTWLW